MTAARPLRTLFGARGAHEAREVSKQNQRNNDSRETPTEAQEMRPHAARNNARGARFL
jgi:hypothetical protein